MFLEHTKNPSESNILCAELHLSFLFAIIPHCWQNLKDSYVAPKQCKHSTVALDFLRIGFADAIGKLLSPDFNSLKSQCVMIDATDFETTSLNQTSFAFQANFRFCNRKKNMYRDA